MLLCFCANTAKGMTEAWTQHKNACKTNMWCIGRLSADIISGRLQAEQVNELRNFSLLNLAWSSTVKLLVVLAKAPDHSTTAKSKLSQVCCFKFACTSRSCCKFVFHRLTKR